MNNDATIKQVIEAIAPILKPSHWEPYKQDDWYCWELRHRDGASVSVRSDHGKLRFSPHWPLSSGWGSFEPAGSVQAISISPTRKPQDIVRDLARRLLAPYLPQHAVALQAQAAWKEEADDISRCTARLSDIIGGTISPHQGDPKRMFGEYANGISVDGTVNSLSSVELKIRWITAEQAEQLLAMIAPWLGAS